jgi:UDP-glucose 4-epimerase
MARVLVTGGAGFIGSHVVDAFVMAGHTVAIVDDFSTGTRDHLNPAAVCYERDIRDPAIADVFEAFKPEVVSHHAAQIDVRRSIEDPAFDADVNIIGGLNLLECSVKAGIKKFLFASTGGAIYGKQEDLPVDEDRAPNPECHYAASKLAFEHYIHLYARLYQLPYVILRYPNVYGPRQRPDGEAGVCAILTGRMLDGNPPTLYGNGSPLRDYVYVGDIARANVLSLDRGENVVVNLGSGKGTSVRQLFETLAELTGFAGEPVLAPLRRGEIDAVYLTGDRAASEIGWQPEVDLAAGLRATVEHIRQHGTGA